MRQEDAIPINLASDNVTGCSPSIQRALANAAAGTAAPYGADPWTERLEERLRTVFEHPDLTVFPVATGTAANALALSCLCPPWGAVLCHAESHINVDEAGAPELFTGGAKLIPLADAIDRVTPKGVARAATHAGGRSVHRGRATVLSITQATELGGLYTLAEVEALAEVCRRHDMALHMDGARFANALVGLGCSPAEATWKAGVDVLSFGATKNGAWAAEAVIFFDPAKGAEFDQRRKRGGHLFSKHRFLSAQLLAYLDDDLWLTNARHANAQAARLAEAFRAKGLPLVGTPGANAVFVDLPEDTARRLTDAGVIFAPWDDAGPHVARFVCSFETDPADVDTLIGLL